MEWIKNLSPWGSKCYNCEGVDPCPVTCSWPSSQYAYYVSTATMRKLKKGTWQHLKNGFLHPHEITHFIILCHGISFVHPRTYRTGWNHNRELWYIGGTNTEAVVAQWMEGRQTCDMVWSILEGYLLLLSELNKYLSWLSEWGSGGRLIGKEYMVYVENGEVVVLFCV